MTTAPVVLLVVKTPLLHRLEGDELRRLTVGGVVDGARLEASARAQEATANAVRAALVGCTVVERSIGDLRPEDADGVQLVVTVGGDGTVFTANTLATDVPFLTVNSDPGRSVGHFTRFTAANVADGVRAWRAGSLASESQYRLLVSVGECRHRILNDCLFAHRNPAVLCRYVLETSAGREYQRSSGVWVSTAAGSTAAIRSAGASPVPADRPALLFKVREPYDGHDAPAQLRSGCQTPPEGLVLTAATPGMTLYIDGPNVTVPVPAGSAARITADPHPLRLLLPQAQGPRNGN